MANEVNNNQIQNYPTGVWIFNGDDDVKKGDFFVHTPNSAKWREFHKDKLFDTFTLVNLDWNERNVELASDSRPNFFVTLSPNDIRYGWGAENAGESFFKAGFWAPFPGENINTDNKSIAFYMS
jgi:hypothetical protein